MDQQRKYKEHQDCLKQESWLYNQSLDALQEQFSDLDKRESLMVKTEVLSNGQIVYHLKLNKQKQWKEVLNLGKYLITGLIIGSSAIYLYKQHFQTNENPQLQYVLTESTKTDKQHKPSSESKTTAESKTKADSKKGEQAQKKFEKSNGQKWKDIPKAPPPKTGADWDYSKKYHHLTNVTDTLEYPKNPQETINNTFDKALHDLNNQKEKFFSKIDDVPEKGGAKHIIDNRPYASFQEFGEKLSKVKYFPHQAIQSVFTFCVRKNNVWHQAEKIKKVVNKMDKY